MKKILIIGPIGDYGGRELMTGFIASIALETYYVEVCSTGFLSERTQVKNFFKGKIYSIGQLVFKKHFNIRLLAYLSYFKNKRKKSVVFYVNNPIAKRFFNYKEKVEKRLIELVDNFDGFIINAQLQSEYCSFLIDEISKQDKKVIFRTTGTIKKEHFYESLNKVDWFIHHSMNNCNRLNLSKHNYTIIDQCSFIEDKLLKIPFTQNTTTFLLLGRLSKEKGVDKIIQWFDAYGSQDKLFVVGDGALKEVLMRQYSSNSNILFFGQIEVNNLDEIFKQIDCLLISSYEESGPLVGVEAMAAGKIIISTKVGAMMERLESTLNHFFYDIESSDLEDFSKQYQFIKRLSSEAIEAISKSLRDQYIKHHSEAEIKKKYKTTINSIFT